MAPENYLAVWLWERICTLGLELTLALAPIELTAYEAALLLEQLLALNTISTEIRQAQAEVMNNGQSDSGGRND